MSMPEIDNYEVRIPYCPEQGNDTLARLQEFMVEPGEASDYLIDLMVAAEGTPPAEIVVSYDPDFLLPDFRLHKELKVLAGELRFERFVGFSGRALRVAARGLALVGYTFAHTPNPLFRMAPWHHGRESN